MRQWTGSALVQVKACRLFGDKPLPEPMLAHCQLDSWEQISVKLESKFIQENAFEIVVCQNGILSRGRLVKDTTLGHTQKILIYTGGTRYNTT